MVDPCSNHPISSPLRNCARHAIVLLPRWLGSRKISRKRGRIAARRWCKWRLSLHGASAQKASCPSDRIGRQFRPLPASALSGFGWRQRDVPPRGGDAPSIEACRSVRHARSRRSPFAHHFGDAAPTCAGTLKTLKMRTGPPRLACSSLFIDHFSRRAAVDNSQ
jgi:hypothetical protein